MMYDGDSLVIAALLGGRRGGLVAGAPARNNAAQPDLSDTDRAPSRLVSDALVLALGASFLVSHRLSSQARALVGRPGSLLAVPRTRDDDAPRQFQSSYLG